MPPMHTHGAFALNWVCARTGRHRRGQRCPTSATTRWRTNTDPNPKGAPPRQQRGGGLTLTLTPKVLHLGNNAVEDAGAGALGRAIEGNLVLRELVLNDNRIGPSGLNSIFTPLRLGAQGGGLSAVKGRVSGLLLGRVRGK